MAQNMTGTLREQILRHVIDIYFPQDFFETIWETIPQIWETYLDSTLGPLPKGVFVPEATIYINTEEPKLKKFLNESWNFKSFRGRRALFPFCSLDENSTTHLTLNVDSCPIQQLRDTLAALAEMYSEKCDFRTALNSELLKTPSVETFLKRFPETTAALAPWVRDMVVDLPVSCEINMEEIGFEAV